MCIIAAKACELSKAKYGKGVFASKEFFTEDFIGPVAGEVIIDPDYGSDYGIDLGEHTLEPAAPFRYLNHSCEPNCELVYFEANEDDPTAGPQIWIEIIRDTLARRTDDDRLRLACRLRDPLPMR